MDAGHFPHSESDTNCKRKESKSKWTIAQAAELS
jgi:hypothetical protein